MLNTNGDSSGDDNSSSIRFGCAYGAANSSNSHHPPLKIFGLPQEDFKAKMVTRNELLQYLPSSNMRLFSQESQSEIIA